MLTVPISPIEDINAALLSHNPFSQPPFVNANNVWGKSFPDVETLNAHASDAVFKALAEIRAKQYRTTSILITAQNGTGKTHIISRIRHRLQVQGGALFVFANKFNDLNQIKNSFQQVLAESLSNIGSEGVKQWQELATAMANSSLQISKPTAQPMASKHLVEKFDNAEPEQVEKWVNDLARTFRKVRNVKDPDVVRAIFWTLSEEQASYASNWLAGKELAQFKANELRLPNQCQSFDAVLQVLELISAYNELVICFDELDPLEFNDAGLHKSLVVAGLVKELFENLDRGVILTVMMPGTWNERVKQQLPGGVSSKMTANGEPYSLKYMDSNSIIELVKFTLREYYESRDLIPPSPLYPFEEDVLREIGGDKPTVREVLQWCKENCKPAFEPTGTDPVPPSLPVPINPVEIAFANELQASADSDLDDNYLIADALFYGFQAILGETVEEVTLDDVVTGVKKRGGKDTYLNFKVLGSESGVSISIGVSVLQYDGGGGLGAGFRRLLDQDGAFGLTRGCLVRSKQKLLNSYFTKTYLTPLINSGGEFVDLRAGEIHPLIAIRAVWMKRSTDYNVTEEQINQFISDKGEEYLLGIFNPLLREILSKPSYEVPQLADEPEQPEKLSPPSQSESEGQDTLLELVSNG
jgi:hypothetical protein